MMASHPFPVRDYFVAVMVIIGVIVSLRIMFMPSAHLAAPGHFAHQLPTIVKPSVEFAKLGKHADLVSALTATFAEEKFECKQSVAALCKSALGHYCDAIDESGKLEPGALVAHLRPNWNWLQAEALVRAYQIAYNISNDSPLVSAALEMAKDIKRAQAKRLKSGDANGGICTPELLTATTHAHYNDLSGYRGALFKIQYNQRSPLVNTHAYHPASNAMIGVNSLCGVAATGEHVFHPNFDVTHNYLLGKKEIAKAMRAANGELQRTAEDLLLAAYTSDAENGGAAERLLVSKVSIWRPLSVHQRERTATTALRAMMRPTILCVTLTTYDAIELALLQHALWARNCDDHLILALPVEMSAKATEAADEKRADSAQVQQQDPHNLDGQQPKAPSRGAGGRRTSKRSTMPNNIDDLAAAVGMRPYKIIDLDPQQNYDPADKHNRWQRFRSASAFLDNWPFRNHFGYFFFVDETVYAVPENLHALVMLPEIYHLNSLGAPLLLGNRMILPKEGVPYVAAAAGMLLSSGAFEMFLTMQNSAECNFDTASNADDALLAHCLSQFGVVARDTSDELGQDRMHIMTPSWLIRLALHPESSWWYRKYRPRPLDGMDANVFLSLSSSTVSFGGVNTIAKALRLHRNLWLSA